MPAARAPLPSQIQDDDSALDIVRGLGWPSRPRPFEWDIELGLLVLHPLLLLPLPDLFDDEWREHGSFSPIGW